MVTRPTPEMSARKVLAVFLSFQVRPGNYLPIQSLRSGWKKKGLHFEHLPQGIEYSLQQGWVESKQEGSDDLWLTEIDLSEASG